MNKYFHKFININKRIIKKYENPKGYVLLVDRGRHVSAVISSLAAAAINKKFKLNTLIVTDQKKNSSILKLYKSFGFENFRTGFNYALTVRKFFTSIYAVLLSLNALLLLKKNKFQWFVDKFRVKNVKIGDVIYDTYVRHDQSYRNPKIDIKFINILFKTIFRTLNILNFIKKYPTKFIVTGTWSYAYNSGIAVRIGLEKKIKVTGLDFHHEYGEFNNIVYSKEKIKFGLEYINLKDPKVKFLFNRKMNVKMLNVYIKKRFKGLVACATTSREELRNANLSKTDVSREGLLKQLKIKKLKIKKIILIAPHAFSDAARGLGSDYPFLDYYDQLKKTLEFVRKNLHPNILWLVKPHPSSPKYGEEGIAENFVQKINADNIKICPKNLATQNLIKICDNVVTGRGIIGLEFACYGKYPITAGKIRYSGLGVAMENKNKKEYFSTLLNIEEIPKLKKRQILVAKKALYFLETNKPKNTLKNSKIFNSNILKKTQYKDESLFFCKQLIINLSKKKIEQDSLYEDFFKTIKY